MNLSKTFQSFALPERKCSRQAIVSHYERTSLPPDCFAQVFCRIKLKGPKFTFFLSGHAMPV